MRINSILIILNLLGLLGSIVWLIAEKSLEPLITVIGLIGSLIALIYSKNNNDSNTIMKQKGGKNSKNYQSGRDINIK